MLGVWGRSPQENFAHFDIVSRKKSRVFNMSFSKVPDFGSKKKVTQKSLKVQIFPPPPSKSGILDQVSDVIHL